MRNVRECWERSSSQTPPGLITVKRSWTLLADQTRTTGGETQLQQPTDCFGPPLTTDQTNNTRPPCRLINISASQEILSMGPDTGQGKISYQGANIKYSTLPERKDPKLDPLPGLGLRKSDVNR